MTRRRVMKYVDALIEGRRPPRLRARSEDAALVRTAIILKQANADEAAPREEFVSSLFQELEASHGSFAEVSAAPAVVRPLRRRPVRVALVSAAAAVALVAGTAGITVAVDHPAAPSGSFAAALTSGTLAASGHSNVGEVNLYRGSPSWVFMNVDVPSYTGPVACELEARNGAILASGSFRLVDGSGEWARTLPVNPGAVHAARVVTPTGAVLASVTFS
jgi:hypothetical protein